MRWTFLRGTPLLVGGIVGLLGALSFTGLGLVGGLSRREAGFSLLMLLLLGFVSLHLIAIGLYQMLKHLYRSISRTDPAGDRSIRGGPFYLLGYLGGVMSLSTMLFFMLLPLLTNGEARWERVVWGVVPTWFVTLGAGLVYALGALLMITDVFRRYQEIERRRQAEVEQLRPEDEPDVPSVMGRPGPSRPTDYPEGIEQARRRE